MSECVDGYPMAKAILLSIDEDLAEMRALLSTLEIEIVETFLQKRSEPHKNYYLGPGKIDEVVSEVDGTEYDYVVINGDLRPSQHHAIEMKFQKECIDRIGVILRIFREHAHTKEAKAQVDLARFRYELPFLREWIHKAKSGERPGFLSGGEYATQVYYQHARSHMKRIEDELRALSVQREVRRAQRKTKGYSLVSIAGYTNAGKSALLNSLCDASIEVDDRYFSTLSTTTKRLPGKRRNVLVTDTVGFIKKLPPDLVDAFNSTLEEIYYADLILLVFDASEDMDVIEDKLSTSLDILLPRLVEQRLLVVGNKLDLISEEKREEVHARVSAVVAPHELLFVSAERRTGLDLLVSNITLIQNRTEQIVAELPLTDNSKKLLSKLYGLCEVTKDEIEGDHIAVALACSPEDVEKIAGWLQSIGASVVSIDRHPTAAGPQIRSSGSEGGSLRV
jgi:GTP-binding protein HflX